MIAQTFSNFTRSLSLGTEEVSLEDLMDMPACG